MTETERALAYLADFGLTATVEPNRHYEYGARDPDNRDKINYHPTYELALDASKWWAIDHRVYRREVTDWEVMDD